MFTSKLTRRQVLKACALLPAASFFGFQSKAHAVERIDLLKGFLNPYGIACHGDGRIVVADAGHYVLRIYSKDYTLLTEIGGPGAGGEHLNYPQGIAVDDDFIYVVDSNNGRVVRFDWNGQYINHFGSIGGYPGAFYTPKGITVTDNAVFVANTRNHMVYKFDKQSNKLVQSYGLLGDDPLNLRKGSKDYRFRLPTDVAVHPNGNIYIVDSKHNVVKVVAQTGEFLFKFGKPGNGLGQFNRPEGIAIGNDKHIYVCDSLNKRIQRFNEDGSFAGQIDQGLVRPTNIFVDRNSRLYIVDSDAQVVKILKWS